MKSLIVVFSYHRHNTKKIAQVFARVLGAQIVTPLQFDPSQVGQYDLVGFGSGIDSDKHYLPLLDFADKLPPVAAKKHSYFQPAAIPLTSKNTRPNAIRPFGKNWYPRVI